MNAEQIKRIVARLTRFWIIHQFLWIAVKLVVPKRRVGGGVLLFNEQGKILLLNHAFHGKHPWGLPGGWLNRKEEPTDGVLRELREETGLTATLGPIVWFQQTVRPPDLNVYYLATDPKGTLKLSFEIVSAAWFDPDVLPDGMLPTSYEMITKAQLLVTDGTYHIQAN